MVTPYKQATDCDNALSIIASPSLPSTFPWGQLTVEREPVKAGSGRLFRATLPGQRRIALKILGPVSYIGLDILGSEKLSVQILRN